MAQAAEETSQKRIIHYAAYLFPMMTDEEYQALKEDIKTHGQLEPILYWKNMLVDGRNRLKACEELGIEPREVELEDETDPLAYVLSHNLHRRHLTTSQRSMVAANVAKLKHGDNQHTKEDGSIDLSTQQEAASLLNVSVPSVKRAKKVKDKGTPELAEMVSSGKVSVDAASKVATKPKAEQEAIVAKGPVAVKEAAACVPKKVGKGGGTPKPDTKEKCRKCKILHAECKMLRAELLKLKALITSLEDSLLYARGQVRENCDSGLFPFLDTCHQFWNRADKDARESILEAIETEMEV